MIKITQEEFQSLLELYKGQIKRKRWSGGMYSRLYSDYYRKTVWWQFWSKELLFRHTISMVKPYRDEFYKLEGI